MSGLFIYVEHARIEQMARHHAPSVEEQIVALEEDVEEEVGNPLLSEDGSKVARFERLMDRLPAREADILSLYLAGKNQGEIARIFGVTQPAISYTCKVAIKRLKTLISMPELTEDEIRHAASYCSKPDIDAAILLEIYRTWCQSAVAKRLGLSQGRVRGRLVRAIRRLKERVAEDPSVRGVLTFFSRLHEEKLWNRSIELQQWKRRQRERALMADK